MKNFVKTKIFIIAFFFIFTLYSDAFSQFKSAKMQNTFLKGKITLLSPNGGENIRTGSRFMIKWRSNGVKGNVELSLLKGRRTIKLIAKNVPVNRRSFLWNLNRSLPVGGGFFVQIRSMKVNVKDVSDRAFSILKVSGDRRDHYIGSSTDKAEKNKNPVVKSASKTGFSVEQLKSVRVVFFGKNLSRVKFAEVIANGNTPDRNFNLNLKSVSNNKIEAVISALISARPGKNYGIKFLDQTKKTLVKVGLNIFRFEVKKRENVTTPQQTQKKPDLIVTEIVQDPPNPLRGESWHFKVKIKNIGNANAFFPRGIKIIAHNAQGSFSGVTDNMNITIAPGQTLTKIQYPGVNKSGTFPVTFKVDPENAVDESNENNNTKVGSYTVRNTQGLPDLIITSLTTDPAVPTTQGFFLNVTIKNRGTGVVNLQGGLKFIIKSVNTNTIALKGILMLSPGQSRSVKCYATHLSKGTFTWTIKVDPDNHIMESDENNNTKDISLKID